MNIEIDSILTICSHRLIVPDWFFFVTYLLSMPMIWLVVVVVRKSRTRGQKLLNGFAVAAAFVAIMVFTFFISIGGLRRSPYGNERPYIALQAALENYHAQEGEWSFHLDDLEVDPHNKNIYCVSNENNAVVFEKLIYSDVPYIDVTEVLTCINGRRMSVKKALEKGYRPISLGYELPRTKEFKYFVVTYNSSNDYVRVRLPQKKNVY